ncbi:uncharacterized protein LOC134710669 [Mytilus trossulus]|uniref:uncharacterized protein LOC134710669 n=1 Tax=Mytilus trossulus TaxID=6551 RepID=UPI0030068CCA
MDLVKLKSVRSGNRSAVTRLFRRLDEAKENSNFDEEEVIATLGKLVQKQTLFEDLNEQILKLTEPEDVENEIVDSDEYSVDMETKIRHIRKCIQNVQTPQSRHIDSHTTTHTLNPETIPFVPTHNIANPHNAQSFENPSVQASHTFNTQQSSFSSASSHRLPKLSLPIFSGNILEWQTFWDSYESAVHLNLSLTNVQKFNYLKAQLEHEALDSIAGFALTNVNYDEAVNLLKERFGQQDKIINAYMQALLEIPSPRNQITSLRSFYDKMESYVRGLEALGQTQETYGTLLVPIIMKKLPGEVRQHLAREHRIQTWVLRDLRRSILDEINIMDAGQELESTNHLPTTSSFFAGAKLAKSKSVKNIETRPCVFCHEIHAPTQCSKITDTESRMIIVKRDKLCFNCLGNHKINECKSENTCRYCNRKHHTSLCNAHKSNAIKPGNEESDRNGGNTSTHTNFRANDNQSNNPLNPLNPQNPQNPSSLNSTNVHLVKDSHTTEQDTTILFSKSKESRSNVLLKTAVAQVGANQHFMDTNILLDEGAQRSFLTQEVANKLHLQIEGTELIQLSAFEGKDKTARHLENTTVYLKTDAGHVMPIKVLIVPFIAMPLQNQTSNIDTEYEYLRGLKLAHTTTEQDSFQISLLVGADHYRDIVEDHVVRGNGPTAVKSKIGYLLSGPTYGKELNTSNDHTLNISHVAVEYNPEKLWNSKSIGINSKEIEEDNTYIKAFARLAWKENSDELPTNSTVTKKRTQNVTTNLIKTPDMLNGYGEIIQEQKGRRFRKKVTETTEISRKANPNHPVHRKSSTTRIRIVNNCRKRKRWKSEYHILLREFLRTNTGETTRPIANYIRWK